MSLKIIYSIISLLFLTIFFYLPSPIFAEAKTDFTPPVCNRDYIPGIPPSYQVGTINPQLIIPATDDFGININTFVVTALTPTNCNLLSGACASYSSAGPSRTISETLTSATIRYSWSSNPNIAVGSYPLGVAVRDKNGNNCTYDTSYNITETPQPFLKTSGGDVHSNR